MAGYAVLIELTKLCLVSSSVYVYFIDSVAIDR